MARTDFAAPRLLGNPRLRDQRGGLAAVSDGEDRGALGNAVAVSPPRFQTAAPALVAGLALDLALHA